MNLANCKPSEFLKQTHKIKKSVEKWLKDTDFLNIRKEAPEIVHINKDMTDEERAKAFSENKRKMQEQGTKNAMKILDAALDKYADETLEILALCCFVEPSKVDDYTIDFYLENFTEILNNKAVVGFFTSLAQLGAMDTPNA